MIYEIFKRYVIAGSTYVVCPCKVPDMAEGWDKVMDSMVGIPLLVNEKTPSAVFLTNEDGNTFMFGYKHIELAEEVKKVKVLLNNYEFFIEDTLASLALQEKLLEIDRMHLAKVKGVDLNLPRLSIRSEQLTEIQQKCPRVIGALLSNNLMRRVK